MRVTRPSASTATVLVASLALCAPSRVAFADPDADPLTADQHRDAGYRHAERSEWDAALRDYQAAYELDHDPVSLYAIGRVHVRRGECAAAIDAFRRFLATAPPAKARASAEAEITTCEATLAAAHPEPPPDATPSPPPRPPSSPRTRAFYTDPVGGVLVGGGAVALGLGTYFYVRARGELCDDPCTGTYTAYQDSLARAHTWRTTAVIAGGLGGALVVAGAIRWATHRERAPVDVALTPRPRGAMLTVGAEF